MLAVHTYAAGKTDKPKRRRTNRVHSSRVNRQVWLDAMRLAGYDHRRLQIIDLETVIVWNHPKRGTRRYA